MRGRWLPWAVGILAFLVAAAPWVYSYLWVQPRTVWQVDLEVYREAARALVTGEPLYDLRTNSPQYLPFTYPPFAAVAGLPLLLAPFSAMGWIWTFVQLGLLWMIVGLAFRPLLSRLGPWGPVLRGVVAAACVCTLAVSDSIRFGQVNAVIVGLCLADLARSDPRDGRPLFWPRGALVGVAAAIKLTPAVFWVHWAVTRQWRTLAVSVGTAGGLTALVGLFAPSATAAFWTDALLDPNRLGANDNTSNQSMRGALIRMVSGRTTLHGAGWSLAWVAAVLAVSALAVYCSARLDRAGDTVGVVACLGLMAFLVSPVSWIHHLFWGVVALGALTGDGRRRRRLVVAGIFLIPQLLRLPWWGEDWLAHGSVPVWLGKTVQDGYTVTALLGLVLLWWFVVRPLGRSRPAGADATDLPADRPAARGASTAGEDGAEAAESGPTGSDPAGPRVLTGS